jgi:hypothetical protein
MLDLLIAAYRANPLRPHCNGNVRHVWLCRVLGFSVKDGPGGLPLPNTRCPAKGN